MSLYSRRRLSYSLLCLLLVLSSFVSLSFFFDLEAITRDALPDYVSHLLLDNDYPPNHKELRKWIHDLPQHDLSLPFPEGKNGRYVKFSCQVQQLGWNNLLNEVCVAFYIFSLILAGGVGIGQFLTLLFFRLMNNYLAYRTNRAYVFSDFVWKREYYPWPEEKARNWPPISPLPSLISGPTVGDPWPANDPAPRSISGEWFEVVCPPERRKIINTREIKPYIREAGGREIFETWRKALNGPEPCIEIQSATREEDQFSQVFDLWIWGAGKMIEIWDEFKASPVSQSLGASHIVQNALEVNDHIFHASSDEIGVVDPYSRMLAIHLRRGDFKQACKMLSDYNATFYSWNLFDFLPDKFTPPSGGTMGKNTPENDARYFERCLPSDDDILRKIRDSRSDYLLAAQREGRRETVDVLYILTNDDSEWLMEVKKTMMNEGWRVVKTSRDLTLNREGKEASMAVDMEIARKASVFIGNGVSAKNIYSTLS